MNLRKALDRYIGEKPMNEYEQESEAVRTLARMLNLHTPVPDDGYVPMLEQYINSYVGKKLLFSMSPWTVYSYEVNALVKKLGTARMEMRLKALAYDMSQYNHENGHGTTSPVVLLVDLNDLVNRCGTPLAARGGVFSVFVNRISDTVRRVRAVRGVAAIPGMVLTAEVTTGPTWMEVPPSRVSLFDLQGLDVQLYELAKKEDGMIPAVERCRAALKVLHQALTDLPAEQVKVWQKRDALAKVNPPEKAVVEDLPGFDVQDADYV